MKNENLSLLPNVQAVESDGCICLKLNGKACVTTDRQQIAILRALLSGSQSVDSLMSLLHKKKASPGSDAFNALTLADFILHFKDFLEP